MFAPLPCRPVCFLFGVILAHARIHPRPFSVPIALFPRFRWILACARMTAGAIAVVVVAAAVIIAEGLSSKKSNFSSGKSFLF
jgi:hypothetical protein